MHENGYQCYRDVSLYHFNAFKVNVRAKNFILLKEKRVFFSDALTEKLKYADGQFVVLGGGTNILFIGDFPGTIISVRNREFEFEYRGDYVILTCGGGIWWDEIVSWATTHNLYGIENMAGIPGLVGAAPVQNIGAYGSQLSDVILSSSVFDVTTGKVIMLSREEMELTYRNSIFKKNPLQYIVIGITLRLSISGSINADYPDVRKYLKSHGISINELNPLKMAEIIRKIRLSKLPDPAVVPNCGSFFKNPIIDEKKLNELLGRYPEMPFFKTGENTYKIPAAFLIEKLGWKGKVMDGAGISPSHALVLVNYSDRYGTGILKLAMFVRKSVYEELGIKLSPEVVIIYEGKYYNIED